MNENLVNPFIGFDESANDIISNDDKAFMEAYFGSLPELDRIDSLYAAMQKKYQENPKTENPNTYKELKEISRLYCKVFGFKKVHIYFAPIAVANAFTDVNFALSVFGNYEDYLEIRSDKGIYDTSHRTEVCIYMTNYNLSADLGFNGRHLNAITLHEIGHNLDTSLYHCLGYIFDTIITMGIGTIPTTIELLRGKTSIEDINEYKLRNYYNITDNYNNIYDDASQQEKMNEQIEQQLNRMRSHGKIYYLMSIILYTFASVGFTLNIYTRAMALLFMGQQLDGRVGEQFADSLPSSYGYSVELMEALDIFATKGANDPYKQKDQSKGTVFLRDMNTAIAEIFNGVFECHGTNQQRCKESIIKLKSDLKKSDFPPEMKETLEKEVRRLEGYYQQMITVSPDKHDMIQKTLRRLIEKILGGRINIGRFLKRNQV